MLPETNIYVTTWLSQDFEHTENKQRNKKPHSRHISADRNLVR